MATPYQLTVPGLAVNFDALASYVAPVWDQLAFDVPDWLERTITGRVAGVVTVRNIGRAREVLVLSAEPVDGQYRVLAEVTSGGDGAFAAEWLTYQGKVLVVGLSQYGETWQAERIYQVGEAVSPTEWNGFMYVCEQPGTAGSEEPVWPLAEEAAVFVGSAVCRAQQYLPIVAHGPLQPVIEVS
ncbi:hypothetical protein [Aeromonas caviae]|uniref:hypothetical protein n=1 Tax=Aeromonas caviae TaxID=648 RepID=UPI000DD60BFC|nr:hypothetical protein [Aeromonas caviae]AXB01446.1 hypothetical protein C1C92_11050 [Aeromonas caviae]MBL0496186.1 hypothetical protein [Aeromonas caviae]QLL79670.1 hypothetical protein GWC92_04630 [Aeromonas caviae]